MHRAQNPQQKPSKQKYIKPQVFSISNTLKPTNAAHCRSLVDLNNIQTSSQKENHNNDHYSSVTSNQDTKNIQEHGNINANGNGGGKFLRVSNNSRQALMEKGNISNIAKMLLNASKGKTSGLYQSGFNKNSGQLHGEVRKNDILADMINPKHKKQTRTSSQVNLRQTNNSIPKKQNQFQTLQSQKSQKSLKKPSHSPSPSPNNIIANECGLLLKLKQYIEQLKENQQIQQSKLAKLKEQNKIYAQEIILLKDKVQVYQIRQKQMLKKLKQQQAQIQKLSTNPPNPKQPVPKNQCHDHLLIIQSLRNVINEQMTKIIEMETYKVQLNEQNSRNGGQRYGHGQKRREDCWETKQSEGDAEDEKYQEVYSFKKRNNLNQSSIYIEDQQREPDCYSKPACKPKQHHSKVLQERKKNKSSQSSIPQPYKQLIKCLKTDSRVKQPTPASSSTNQEHRSRNSADLSSQRQHHDLQEQDPLSDEQSLQQQMMAEDMINQMAYKEEVLNDREQCSEDQILQEVGQYLQNIRRNVREG